MAAHWFQVLIDWVGLPSLALLAGVLIYRRWYRQFPFFTLYVIGAELVGVARLFFLRSSLWMYSRFYWISDAALAALAFLAAYELFFKRLFPGFYKTRFYRVLFPTAAILIIVAVSCTALIGGHFSALAMTTRVFVFLRLAILAFFVVLMQIMGRQWSRQEFGIAFGFALDASTSSIFLGLLIHGASRNAILKRIAVFAYDIACILWLYCFWPAPTQTGTPSAPELSTEVLDEAKKWEGSLKDFMSQGKS
jgi:hypothetical protein